MNKLDTYKQWFHRLRNTTKPSHAIELLIHEVQRLKANETWIKERDQLRAERNQLRGALKAKRQWESDMIKVVRTQGDSIIELVQQLYRFGRHKRDCNYVLRTKLELGTKDCDCGWSAIEKESNYGSS